MKIPADGHPLDPPPLHEMRLRNVDAMRSLAGALEAAIQLRNDLVGSAPAREIALAITSMQSAAFWLTLADTELLGEGDADSVIVEALRDR